MKNKLNECVVAGKKTRSGCFIGKNRDRTYMPNIEIIHGLYPNLEYVIIHDSDTGYAEGVNVTSGIAVLNSSLLNGKDFGKNKSPEGSRLLKSLLRSNSIEELINYITKVYPVYGCTVIADRDDICILEHDTDGWDHKIYSNIDDYVVRSNHGTLRKDSGYSASSPVDYLSSRTREATGEIILDKSETIEDLMANFSYPFFDNLGAINISRNTDYMNTTNQIGIDMNRNIFRFINVPGKQNFKGIRKLGPWTTTPKFKIEIPEYSEPLKPTFDFWGLR
tara:strand:- start:16 stop:849 length:834 start_codon:yes stop_codon:yes gene_type:complete